MKNYLIIALFSLALFAGCKGEKKVNQDSISALSIIKGQLNKIDSSLAAFTLYEKNNDKADTVYLKREEVRNFAGPFVLLPDISDKNYQEKYTEERLIDEQQANLSITSTLKDSEDSELQKQIIIVDLSDNSNGNVQSIFFETYKRSADSTIEQKLFWELDKLFTIHTTIEKENQPQKTHYIKVAWQ